MEINQAKELYPLKWDGICLDGGMMDEVFSEVNYITKLDGSSDEWVRASADYEKESVVFINKIALNQALDTIDKVAVTTRVVQRKQSDHSGDYFDFYYDLFQDALASIKGVDDKYVDCHSCYLNLYDYAIDYVCDDELHEELSKTKLPQHEVV